MKPGPKAALCPVHQESIKVVPQMDDEGSAERIEDLKRQGYEVMIVDTVDGLVVLKRKRLDLQ
ncbi:MAG TPA: hypothetical protein VL175_21850 [Pirellulales bacterium]|jgi:hypothetical protein|nr:hypothetical protein [Pirellulales bacterium]